MTVSNTRVAIIGAAAAVVLGVGTTAGIALTGSSTDVPWRSSGQNCSVPNLSGQVVDVTVTDMGPMIGGRGPMMGNGSMMGPNGYPDSSTNNGGPGYWGPMGIFTSERSVPAGQVSLRVRNAGGLPHEVIVMPLTGEAKAGQRAIGTNGEVDETGSIGEASKTCGSGEGDGIAPGSSGWVTLNLPAGRYELLCNIEGHYASGTYAELDVT